MLNYEFKKLMIKNYGLILILLLLIIKILISLNSIPVQKFNNNTTEKYYSQYMSVLEGKFTQEKENFILNEKAIIADAKTKEADLSNKLINGFFNNDDEFVDEYNLLVPDLEKQDAFDLIYEKYQAVLQNKDSIYFMSEEIPFLQKDYPDILLLILIIVLTAVLLLSEENTNMILFIKTCKNGKAKSFSSKILLLTYILTIVWFVFTLIDFFIILKFNGIAVLNYPIQSLSYYSTSNHNINFLSLFLLINIIKLCGYFMVMGFVIIIAFATKKPLFTVFIPSAIILLQQFLFSSKNYGYYLPTGLLIAVGYFKGDEFQTSFLGDNTNNIKILFSEVPTAILIINIIIAIIIFSIAIIMGVYRYNTTLKCKKLKCVIAIIGVLLIFSGCNNTKQIEKVNYNYNEIFCLQQNDKYYFAIEPELRCVNKNTYEEFNILRNPFETEEAFSTCIYKDELYFLNNMNNSFIIKSISLKDFSEKQILSQSIDTKYSFLGLTANNDITLNEAVHGFFVDDNNIYLLGTPSNYLYSYNRKSKEITCIIDEKIYSNLISFDGNKIYYVNSELLLKSYDLKSKVTAQISKKLIKSLSISDNYLYYSDKDGTYRYNICNSMEEKINEYYATFISVDNDNIFYTNKDRILYRYNINTKKCSEFCSEWIVYFCCLTNTNKIYIQTFKEDKYDIKVLEY